MAEAQAILTKEEREQRVTLKEASKITGIEPYIIKRHIEEGRLAEDNRHSIDIAELKEYACCLYDANTGNIKMYNPNIVFDANISFYLSAKHRGI